MNKKDIGKWLDKKNKIKCVLQGNAETSREHCVKIGCTFYNLGKCSATKKDILYILSR